MNTYVMVALVLGVLSMVLATAKVLVPARMHGITWPVVFFPVFIVLGAVYAVLMLVMYMVTPTPKRKWYR